MTYFRIKGDGGAHKVLQALMSTRKPVGHVQLANPRPSIPEHSDPGYSNTGYSSSIMHPVYSNPDPGYLFSGSISFSGSSSVNSFSELPLNPKQLSSEYPPNPKQLPSESPPNLNQLSSDEYTKTFNVPIVESLERNPPVSPLPLLSNHGSTNVMQAPLPILKSAEVYVLPSSAVLGSYHGSTNVVQAPVPNLKSSKVYVLPSSALLGPDHGSTSVVQAPPPNPASSIPNPNPLMIPSGPSAAAPMQGSWGIDRFNAAWG